MCKRRGFLQKIAYSFLCVGMIEGVFAEALQENNLLPPPTIQSQSQTNSSNIADSQSSQETIRLNKSTVTATAQSGDIDSDMSKNIIVITKEQIQNKGYQNLEQALEHQPFINFVDTGFGRNIDLRGQGKDANRAVKVLVNGVPINSLDTISGVSAFNNINLEDVESIEVLPGGSSVVYGNGSRGGVINISTKKPDKDYLEVIAKGSSAEALGLQGGGLSILGGKKIGDKLFVYGSVGASYVPGPRNTNIRPPVQISSYSRLQQSFYDNSSTRCPDYVPGADGSIKDGNFIIAPSCLRLGEQKNTKYLNYHDNAINITAQIGINYDINENQRLEFSTNYAHNRLKRIPTYLRAANYYCVPNPNYDPNQAFSSSWNNPYLCNSERAGIAAGLNGIYDVSSDTLKDFRYSNSYEYVGMSVDTLTSSLRYINAISDSLNFDTLAYYQMNIIGYDDYWQDGLLPTMYSTLNGSSFANHGAGLNFKLKHETSANKLIIGLDNSLGYARRNMVMDSILADFNAALSDYVTTTKAGQIGIATTALNTALKTSISPYVYDSYEFADWFELGGGARFEYSHYRVSNAQTMRLNNTANMNLTTNDLTKNDYGLDDTQLQNFMQTLAGGWTGLSLNPEETDFNIGTNRYSYALEVVPNFKYSNTGNAYIKGELGFISPSPFQMIDADPESEINQGGSNGTATGVELLKNTFNNLKPERYLTAELSWKDTFAKSFFFSTTAFYTHTFDEIFLNQTSGTMSFVYRNLGQTQRAGFEFLARQGFFENRLRFLESLSYVWTNILKADSNLMSNYNSVYANFALEGSRVPYVPDWKATLALEGDILKSASQVLSANVNATYTGEAYSLYVSKIDGNYDRTEQESIYSVMNKGGYFLLDFGLTYKNANGLGASIGVRNVLDTFYKTYQQRYYYYPGMGRSYYAEIRWKF